MHTAGVAAERPAGVRLLEVTSESTAASQSVLITATEPASYTTLQPDPLTVLIRLRGVAAGDVTSRFRPAPDDPVGAVDVQDTVDDDGNPVAQVRIGLREPTTYEVRSRRHTIQVRFARLVEAAPAAADVASARSPIGRSRPATALLSVETTVEPDAVSVTFHGNGVLSPGRVHEAEHLPPRLVIDFPQLAAEAAPLTSVELDPVKQVRVATHTPGATRVVLDLARPAVYHLETPTGNDRALRVVFPRNRSNDPVAMIGRDQTLTERRVEAPVPPRATTYLPAAVEGSSVEGPTAVTDGSLGQSESARAPDPTDVVGALGPAFEVPGAPEPAPEPIPESAPEPIPEPEPARSPS